METLTETLRTSLSSLLHTGDTLDILIENIKDKEVVLLGEASHGTHEYYKKRSDITKELIRNHNF